MRLYNTEIRRTPDTDNGRQQGGRRNIDRTIIEQILQWIGQTGHGERHRQSLEVTERHHLIRARDRGDGRDSALEWLSTNRCM